MNSSESLDKLAPALVKAQAAVPAVVKDGVNPHFKSTFATLGAITDAALPALNANGFALIQGGGAVSDDAGLEVVTRLLHTSGQWIESGVRVPMGRADPQAMGSAITYARRYLLAAILGIVADADDDGHAAMPATPASAPPRPSAPRGAVPGPKKGSSGGLPSSCPVCGGRVFDNRGKKASGEYDGKSRDWSCADKECTTEYTPGKRARTGGWLTDKGAPPELNLPDDIPPPDEEGDEPW